MGLIRDLITAILIVTVALIMSLLLPIPAHGTEVMPLRYYTAIWSYGTKNRFMLLTQKPCAMEFMQSLQSPDARDKFKEAREVNLSITESLCWLVDLEGKQVVLLYENGNIGHVPLWRFKPGPDPYI